MNNELPTAEEIAKHYSAMLDSVNLINRLKVSAPPHMSEQVIADIIKRNVDHLNIMLAKTFWTSEDLSVVRAAVA